MVRLTPWLLVLAVGCATRTAQAPAASPTRAEVAVPALWGPLRPGPHAVGLRELAAAPGPHPLPVTLWYPAVAATGAVPWHYRDYVAAAEAGGAATAAARAEAVARYRALAVERFGLPEAQADALLGAPMAAVPDAPPAPGRHPVVLLAQGRFHTAMHQAVLAEVLASHGYVVLSTPSPFRRADAPAPEDVLGGARAQAAELERALLAAQALPFLDAARPALVGHSFGARAAFLLGLTRPDVAALVSLDGGIGNAQGADWLQGAAGLEPAAWRAPLLHVYQSGDPVVTPDLTLLRSLRQSARLLVLLPRLVHLHFSSFGAGAAVAPGLALVEEPAEVVSGHAAAVHLTRLFLDAHVRRDPAALAALQDVPAATGLPPAHVEATVLPPGAP